MSSIKKGIEQIKYSTGVYIQGTDYKLYSIEDYSGQPNFGVAIISPFGCYLIHNNDFGEYYGAICADAEQEDFSSGHSGILNTEILMNNCYTGTPTFYSVCQIKFPSGDIGYLGSYSEYGILEYFKEDVNNALQLIGGSKIEELVYGSSTPYYNFGYIGYCLVGNATFEGSQDKHFVRPLAPIRGVDTGMFKTCYIGNEEHYFEDGMTGIDLSNGDFIRYYMKEKRKGMYDLYISNNEIEYMLQSGITGYIENVSPYDLIEEKKYNVNIDSSGYE